MLSTVRKQRRVGEGGGGLPALGWEERLLGASSTCLSETGGVELALGTGETKHCWPQ